mgnify:CR=1 FL=1
MLSTKSTLFVDKVPKNSLSSTKRVLFVDEQAEQASQPQSGITSSLNVHTPHYQQDVPFEVPKNWAWCKLADIVHELKYGTNLVYSSNEEDIKQYSLEKGDLLFNRTNSSELVGKTAIYKEEQPAIYAGFLIRIRSILMSPDYLNIIMNSNYYRNWCYNSALSEVILYKSSYMPLYPI